MSADISLFDLVNLSIGAPEVGAVNFNALHTLLHALLGHLHIQNVTTSWREEDAPPQEPHDRTPTLQPSSRDKPSPYRHMEDKLRQIERQLERLPSCAELLTRTESGTATPVSDMWQLMQLRRKAQANEDGVSQSMELIQDLLKEIQSLKESRDGLKEQIRTLQSQLHQIHIGELADRMKEVEKCCHRVDKLETAARVLEERAAQYPDPEELGQCVTWDAMQSALVSERRRLQEEFRDSAPSPAPLAAAPPTPPTPTPTPFTPSAPSAAAAPSPRTPTPTPFTPSASVTDNNPPSSSFAAAAAPLTPVPPSTPPPRHPAAAPPRTSLSDGALRTAVATPPSRVPSGAERYPEAVQALREVGRLAERQGALEVRVDGLEAGKADRTQLTDLGERLAGMGDRDTPNNLLEQINHLKTLVDSLMTDREKLGELEALLLGQTGTETVTGRSSETETGSADREDRQEDTGHESQDTAQLRRQIAYLRSSVQKLGEEVQLLKESEAAARDEQQRKKDSLQDQLDGLRGMLEDTMASSSSLLSSSLQRQGSEEGGGAMAAVVPAPDSPAAACPSCSVDVSRKVSQLFQRYEKLQGLVSGLVKQGGAAGGGGRTGGESSELMSDVQGAILQLQADCEKLHGTASLLMDEHSQKQSHIDRLYKSMEELREKKADKELVEMEIEIKADKRSLESKVSRMQFDSMTEQLNAMFQELLGRVSGQEQDWTKVVEKISTEMDCKLNRIELDSVKQQLEERWKGIRKQLQAQPPPPEQDDAAGIRKQLVARFHCISCDRPVDMLTPGSHLVTMPSAPGLPPHRSTRPYTVYELEQVRQHCRSLKAGTNQGHFEAASSERSLAQARQIHALMCRQIERVQSHLGGLARPYSQRALLREGGAPHYPSVLGPLQRTSQSLPKHERIPDISDYGYHGYLALSRSCGGSHTLTHPSRRCSRPPPFAQFVQAEEEAPPPPPPSSAPRLQPEEVDILGLDGHIYKGRLNTRAFKTADARLPTISPGMCRGKDKAVRSQSQKSGGTDTGRGTPARPQSAKTQRSRSASSSSARDRPVSSLACLSQGPLAHRAPPSPADLPAGPQSPMELAEDHTVTSL